MVGSCGYCAPNQGVVGAGRSTRRSYHTGNRLVMNGNGNKISGDQWALITAVPILIISGVVLAVYAPAQVATVLSMLLTGIVVVIGQYAAITRAKINSEKIDVVHDAVNSKMDKLIEVSKENAATEAITGERQRVINEGI